MVHGLGLLNLVNEGFKMNKVNVEFGGFYGSIHEWLIDSTIESYFADDEGEIDYDKVPYKDMTDRYARQYLDIFSEWLNDYYGIDIALHNSRVISPREYNFRTDIIEAELSDTDRKILIDRFIRNTEFLKYLREATKSVSGFISFYTFDDALADKNGVLTEYMLAWLCNNFNDGEFNSYFDRHHCYDNLV